MRPSQRRAKRERKELMKNVGIGAGVLTGIGAAVATAYGVTKKKNSGKTEDQLTDVKEGE